MPLNFSAARYVWSSRGRFPHHNHKYPATASVHPYDVSNVANTLQGEEGDIVNS